MANYRAGDMIRLTRQAAGMSQEELSENICSVQTLSRIENGKVSVKKETYQQLMERMGRIGAKSYSTLETEDFEFLDKIAKLSTTIYRHEYETADKYLQQLKKRMNFTEDSINFCYLRKMETLINFRLGRSSKAEFLEELEKLIGRTIPDYKELLDKVYPFTEEEILTLMNIATAYHEFENYEMAVRIDEMLIRSLETGYMGYQSTARLEIMLLNNVAQDSGGLGEHEKAIELSKKVIQKAKEHKLIAVLPNAYAEIAWNMVEQIKKGERDRNELESCKKYLRQGYAAAAISKQNVVKKQISECYEGYFKENIFLTDSGMVFYME